MIVVTGAAGFIGSCLVAHLNKLGRGDLILVDQFIDSRKLKNLEGKKFEKQIDRELFLKELHALEGVEIIFHIGARTDTTEFDKAVFDHLNVNYSKQIWNYCTEKNVPLVYASSAATYGLGEFGYQDLHHMVSSLKPLNPYGESKNEFDLWALAQNDSPPFWAGLKFFNVYGPNEYHKDRMASVIFHAFKQIQETGQVKLFRSHNPEYDDGKQLRDFVYVKDVVKVCSFLQQNKPESGLYNLGTGVARSFLDLANGVFEAVEMKPNIDFIDTPEDIRDKYQYFTEAKMDKLLSTGYNNSFFTLEEGVKDYVKEYLVEGRYY